MQICYMLCSDPLHRYELLYSWIRVGADPQDELLHHHLLPSFRNVRHRLLDQLPRPAGNRSGPDDPPRHRLPGPGQHLQHHHQVSQARMS